MTPCIWSIFSSSVMRANKSSTRASIGSVRDEPPPPPHPATNVTSSSDKIFTAEARSRGDRLGVITDANLPRTNLDCGALTQVAAHVPYVSASLRLRGQNSSRQRSLVAEMRGEEAADGVGILREAVLSVRDAEARQRRGPIVREGGAQRKEAGDGFAVHRQVDRRRNAAIAPVDVVVRHLRGDAVGEVDDEIGGGAAAGVAEDSDA